MYVANLGEVEEDGHKKLMHLWHVEQMEYVFEVLEQFNMLTPPASATTNVLDEDHYALQEVRVDDLALVLIACVDR